MDARGSGDSRKAIAIVLVVLVCFATLAIGFTVKDLCTKHDWNGYQYKSSCYNDIYALFFFRGVRGTRDANGTVHPGHFPYVDGDGKLEDNVPDGDLEYPVGTGYYIGAIARVAGDNGQEFFRLNALGLALCAIGTALLLLFMTERPLRVLYFAAAPSLALYAFHNWDLLAVVMMVAGLYAYSRRADGWAGVWLGAGAATKLFPGFVLIALLTARFRAREGKPLRMIGSSIATFAAFNIPIMVINWRGWMTPWSFQGTRFPNYETHWYMIYRHLGSLASQSFWFGGAYGKLSSAAGVGIFLLGALLLVRAEWKAERPRPYAMSFALLLLFLLTNKVLSPQYVLWVLPFFALLAVPWYAFAAFAISEAAVWFGISWFFIADLARQNLESAGAAASTIAGASAHTNNVLTLVEIFVFLRYAVLIWLLVISRRAPERALENWPADAPVREVESVA